MLFGIHSFALYLGLALTCLDVRCLGQKITNGQKYLNGCQFENNVKLADIVGVCSTSITSDNSSSESLHRLCAGSRQRFNIDVPVIDERQRQSDNFGVHDCNCHSFRDDVWRWRGSNKLQD